MTEGKGTSVGMNPVEFWRRWYETSSGMWSGALNGDQGNYMDPFGLYQQWFSNMQDSLGEAKGETPETASFVEPWRRWAELTNETWNRTVQAWTVLARLTPYWMEMADEVRKQMLDGSIPVDPLDFYTRWYNATSGPLSKMAKDILGDEAFLTSSRRFLDNYTSLDAIFRRASEDFFGRLQLSTRSDSIRVAELIVGLEDKVDRMEESFEDFEDGYTEPATAEALAELEERLSARSATAESVAELRERLDQVEGKLDQILSALATITNGNAGGQAGDRAGQTGVRATDAARRKAGELGIDLQEVRGSGSGGQVTVDDVRREGESR